MMMILNCKKNVENGVISDCKMVKCQLTTMNGQQDADDYDDDELHDNFHDFSPSIHIETIAFLLHKYKLPT